MTLYSAAHCILFPFLFFLAALLTHSYFVQDTRMQTCGPTSTDREFVLELSGITADITTGKCAQPSVALDIKRVYLRPSYVQICEVVSMCAAVDSFTKNIHNQDRPESQG